MGNVYYTGSLTPNSGTSDGSELPENYIKGGTVLTIPTDYANLTDALASLDGKWSDGAVTIQFVQGTYNITEREIIPAPNCNIPEIIIDGNESTFNSTARIEFNPTGITDSANFKDGVGYKRQKLVLKNINFVNPEESTSITVLGIKSRDWLPIVTKCSFTNFCATTVIYFTDIDAILSYCEFSNSKNHSNEMAFIIAERNTNLYSTGNTFTNTNTSVPKLTAVRSNTGSEVASYKDTFSSNSSGYTYAISVRKGSFARLSSTTLTNMTANEYANQSFNTGVILER